MLYWKLFTFSGPSWWDDSGEGRRGQRWKQAGARGRLWDKLPLGKLLPRVWHARATCTSEQHTRTHTQNNYIQKTVAQAAYFESNSIRVHLNVYVKLHQTFHPEISCSGASANCAQDVYFCNDLNHSEKGTRKANHLILLSLVTLHLLAAL